MSVIADQDRVDLPGLDLDGELVEREPACRAAVGEHWVCQSTSASSSSMWVNSASIASSWASSPWARGPVNHLRALTSQKIPE